jgi:hypothetical protein
MFLFRLIAGIIGLIKTAKKANKIRNMDKADLLALDDDTFYDAIECVCRHAVCEIDDPNLAEEIRFTYSLYQFEMEVNNGGLCQFFVNSSSECAPYISNALEAIHATDLKAHFDDFIEKNNIDVKDLSSFKIDTVEEYEAQTQRYDFDAFDNIFYEDKNFHQLLIDYARENVAQIVK